MRVSYYTLSLLGELGDQGAYLSAKSRRALKNVAKNHNLIVVCFWYGEDDFAVDLIKNEK